MAPPDRLRRHRVGPHPARMSYDPGIDSPATAASVPLAARRIPLPWRGQEVGLGELVKRITSAFGATPCEACRRRAAALDAIVVFTPRRATATVVRSSDCTTYKGKCTGTGGTQCVTAPTSIEPDATTITQCCSGSFQYPWVQVCPGKEATQGCSFCLF